MNKNEEINKLKTALIQKIKLENDPYYGNLSSDEIMKKIIDSSIKGKYVLWVLREYLKGNIQRFEDMGRVKQALTLFKNNLSKFTEQQKQLNKLSFQELESLVEPYQDVLTQNAVKRMNKEKIWEDIDIIYEGPEGKIYVPKTKDASIFLGQGTKWCTAATTNNMFETYNKQGLLYVFVFPEKDENGREIKYQLHFESGQFMNMEDRTVSFDRKNKRFELVDKLIEILPFEKKIRYFFTSMLFSKIANLEKVFDSEYDSLFAERIKLGILFSLYSKDKGKEFIRSYEIAKIAVEKKAENIEYIPQEYLTPELCEMAVKKDGFCLGNIPKEMITKELCEMAVGQNGLHIKLVPSEFITLELCLQAVAQNGSALDSIPPNFMTKEICKVAAKQNGNAIYHVPEDFIDTELCKIAIQSGENALECIPPHFVTEEMCHVSVAKNAHNLSYVPKKFMTSNLCKIAVEQTGLVLDYVPHDFMTKEICETAVKQNGKAFSCVPHNLRTKELAEIAVLNGAIWSNVVDYLDKNRIYELSIKSSIASANNVLYIDTKTMGYDFYKKIVSENGRCLQHIPDNFKTRKLCELAYKNNKSSVAFFAENMFNENELEKMIVEYDVNINLIEKIISNNKISIKNSDNFTKKVVKKFIRNKGFDYDFNEILDLVFALEKNEVQYLLGNIKNCLKEFYVDNIVAKHINKSNKNTFNKM